MSSPTDQPLEAILPALEELDAALLERDHDEFTPELVEDTATQIAHEHSISTDELLENFTLFLILSVQEPQDNDEFYNRLLDYLTTEYHPHQ